MERTSKKDHEYGGKQLKAGDKFELEDPKHLIVLLAFGRVVPEPGEYGYVASNDVASDQSTTQARSRRPSVRR